MRQLFWHTSSAAVQDARPWEQKEEIREAGQPPARHAASARLVTSPQLADGRCGPRAA